MWASFHNGSSGPGGFNSPAAARSAAFLQASSRLEMFLWWLAALAVAGQRTAEVSAVWQFRAAGGLLASTANR